MAGHDHSIAFASGSGAGDGTREIAAIRAADAGAESAVRAGADGRATRNPCRPSLVYGSSWLRLAEASRARFIFPRAPSQDALMAMRSIPHRTVQRGFSYFQVKRVVVAPKGKLSLQRHLHRPNIGCRCAVRPEVTIGHKVSTVHENESVYPLRDDSSARQCGQDRPRACQGEVGQLPLRRERFYDVYRRDQV
jgi:hypothetical protein